MELTHFDTSGAARMVDVSDKDVTVRTAIAEGKIVMQPTTLKLISDKRVAKGDVLQIARIAGIMASKKTADFIPLCHPIPLEQVELDFEFIDETSLLIRALTKTSSRTGVEMEALTAVTTAGLTVYDMCKAVDRTMAIGPFYLVEKTGGKSGNFNRESSDAT